MFHLQNLSFYSIIKINQIASFLKLVNKSIHQTIGLRSDLLHLFNLPLCISKVEWIHFMSQKKFQVTVYNFIRLKKTYNILGDVLPSLHINI